MLAGDGNTEENHYITYQFQSNIYCKGVNYWRTNFEIFCEPDGYPYAQDKDFVVSKNQSSCVINISVRHPAGCAKVNFRQIVDFFRTYPLITAFTLIIIGLISTFFGGYCFQEFAGLVGGLFTFSYITLILSFLGMTSAMDNTAGSRSFGNIMKLILTFVIGLAGAYAVFRLCRKHKKFGAAYIAGLAGIYVAFFVY